VLDHLGVVVGGQVRLALAPVEHGQPAHEVGHPHVRGPLLLGVLVQEVVELPGLVPDPQVVGLLPDDVVEDHEVGHQDLVHPPDRLEGGRSCSADSRSMWVDSLVSQALAGWMRSPSASRTRVTGSWASQSISRPGTSRRSSRAMARSRRAWPSSMGEDRYRARLGRRRARGPGAGGRGRPDPGDVGHQGVHLDRVAGPRRVPGPLEQDQPPAQLGGQVRSHRRLDLGVLGPVDRQYRATDPRAEGGHLGRVGLGEALGEEEVQVPGPVA
jgi:hypothetical protein